MEFVKKCLATINEVKDQFVVNNSNSERSLKGRWNVIDTLSTYQQCLKEIGKGNYFTQITLGSYIKKRQKF